MTKLLLDRRALLATVAASAALSACSSIIGPPEAPPIYLLRPPLPPAGGGPRVGWQMSIVLPEMPDSLDTTRIALQKADGTMDYYANASWPDRLSLLVQSALIDAFTASNRIPAVGRDTEGLKSNYLLSTDVRDFEAIYETPDTAPSTVVRIEARLVGARNRAIVKALSARGEADASVNSVPAVVAAMNQALGDALGQIVGWALAAPPPQPE
ncbi:MAG TPA: ABC-type transport auxiliary lipoprotein family protein [Rhizomicrobium sp.]|nr:ABC-type transport auxiliary lipoprotein family protein [Rhizomicrobium sp.]